MNESKPVWPRVSLVALTGLNLFNYLDRQILPAVLTPIKEELHLTDGNLGMIAVAFMLGYFVTSPIFGYLGDRMSRKWLIACGVFIWSVGTVCSGWAHSFAVLVAFRVLVGFGEASYATLSPGWIADLYVPARRNNALSIFYVAIPVGSALGYLLGGKIEALYGWRSAFLCAGAPGLLLAVGMLFLREPKRGASEVEQKKEPAPSESGLQGYLRLLKIPAYLLVVAGYVAQTFALGGFSIWAPTFLQRVHGMKLEDADSFFGRSLVISGLIATLLGGLAATAWKKRHPSGYAWVIGLSALGAVPAAFAAFLVHDLTLAKAALVASMFFLFLSAGPVNTLILETVPVAMRASAMAMSIFAIHLLGDLWSPAILGYLSDLWGSLRTAVLILPSSLVIAALFWLALAVRWQISPQKA